MNLTPEQLNFFSSLPNETVEKLISCAKMRTIEAGDFLIRENENATTFFIIEEGEVVILRDQIQLGVILKGDILGESSLNGGVRNASAKATRQVKAIEITVPSLAIGCSSALPRRDSVLFRRGPLPRHLAVP